MVGTRHGPRFARPASRPCEQMAERGLPLLIVEPGAVGQHEGILVAPLLLLLRALLRRVAFRCGDQRILGSPVEDMFLDMVVGGHHGDVGGGGVP